MKKWQIISDPLSGKIILIPPSILSLAWWHNLSVSIREKFYRTRVRIWNGGLLLWWHRLWIRKDEFDFSLSMDQELLTVLSPEEQEKYHSDRAKRINSAHHKDDPYMDTPHHQEISKKAALLRKKFNIKSRYPDNGKTIDETIDEIIAENR